LGNTYKIPTQKEKETKKTSAGGSVFSALDNLLKLDHLFEKGVPLEYLPKVLFCTALVIIYIANGHFAERNARKIEKLKLEVEDLRADYITMKSDYMYESKQSEIAKRAETMGIYESDVPPTKIIIKN
jgi:hypothetical protein